MNISIWTRLAGHASFQSDQTQSYVYLKELIDTLYILFSLLRLVVVSLLPIAHVGPGLGDVVCVGPHREDSVADRGKVLQCDHQSSLLSPDWLSLISFN